MSQYSIQSRCECQAMLCATLNSERHVVSGWAARHGVREIAPAHSILASAQRFDVAWLCPYCGRNTMRTFDSSAFSRGAA